MDLPTVVRAILDIGLQKAVQVVLYSIQRDRWEHASRRKHTPEPPGALQEANPIPGGGRFRFAQAGLEIVFLDSDLVRVTWQPGTLPVPYAVVQRKWPRVETHMHRQAQGWTLAGPSFSATVHDDGALRFLDAAGRALRQELPPQRAGDEWQSTACLHEREHIYGLGEHALGLNLRGRSCTLWNSDPLGGYTPGTEPLYLGVPAYLGLHSEGAYLIFYENPFQSTFSFAATAEVRFSGGALRYYIAFGTPAQALERYTELTGRPALPPRWALGYHQSRWGYKTADDIREVAAGFRTHNLPLGVIHLDIDAMDGYRVFTTDPERFPDLAGLVAELEAQGVRVVTIVDCGVKRDPHYEVFREGLEQGMFCTRPDGRPVYAPVWPGWSAFPDFTDPRVRAWWGKQYRRLTAAGVAGFWHDMNEPAAFTAWGGRTLPLSTCHVLEGRGGDHREAHNLYGLLMARAAFEALRETRPGLRPWIVSRSGWAGLQQYAWSWTGDVASTWGALRTTVTTVLGLGLSGIPFTGPDIGGFSGVPLSAELYLRWFQVAAFLPFFRTHSALGTPRREPWVWGEPTLSIVRDLLRLRCRLLPYLYTVAWEANRTGHPMVRPLFWPAADDPALWDVDDAFLLGESLLVAPIVEEGATDRTLQLPAGRWYDFWSDEPLEGPAAVRLAAPLERIPLLVRAGSVLPLEEDGHLVLHLYPPEQGEGGAVLYSDAGEGYSPGRVDRFWLLRDKGRVELTWEVEGECVFPYTSVEVELHGLEAQEVWVNGQAREPANRFPVEPLCRVIVVPVNGS
jgi:alpha-glucosidase